MKKDGSTKIADIQGLRVTKDGKETILTIHGRHDPVIVPRAVVVVESMVAITLVDALFSNMSSRIDRIKEFYTI